MVKRWPSVLLILAGCGMTFFDHGAVGTILIVAGLIAALD